MLVYFLLVQVRTGNFWLVQFMSVYVG